MSERMKLKDCTPEQRAWEYFKFMTFNNGMIAFGLGALTIIFIRYFIPIILLILVAPICYFIVWKLFSNVFLKDGIKT